MIRITVALLLVFLGLPFAATVIDSVPTDPIQSVSIAAKTDSLPSQKPPQQPQSPQETKIVKAMSVPAIVASSLFIAWLFLVVFYYWWAIRYYNQNYGLSDHEWKVLHPEIYATGDKELRKYTSLRASLQPAEGAGDDSSAETPTPPIQEPEENPYQGESFGLPPGTIRGTLALTAMVGFFLVEMVNLFSPTNLEKDFSELLTVFEMVIAFYFGAKAVDVFRKRQETITALNNSGKSAAEGSGTSGDPAVPASTAATAPAAATKKTEPILPAEQPALPSSSHEVRSANIQANAAPASVPDTPPANEETSLSEKTPLARRVLALTAAFETGKSFPECFSGLSGDFDQQGMSFGALQWCIGQNSLQPLLKQAIQSHRSMVAGIFSSGQLQQLEDMLAKPLTEQLAWARSIQLSKLNSKGKRILVFQEEWKSAFQKLGTTPEMIDIQTEAATLRYQKALLNCEDYKCKTERAVALFFDINVQNGHVNVGGARQRILADIQKLPLSLDETTREIETLRIIARRRSEVCKPQWAADVLSRKMTIAEGKGRVHGKDYQLSDYSIGLQPFA